MADILIVDDEPNIRRMVAALLRAEGFDVREASNGAEGVASAISDEPDVAVMDLMMPGELDGMAALEKMRMRLPDLPVIMMSGKADLSDAVKATKLGAFNFLEKPLSPESVLLAITSAMSLRQSRRTARALREELGLAGQMVGSSPAMQQVRELIDKVAPTDARVLITGESGTGKELVAGAIHDASARRNKPLIRVNCAAIPRDLVESEMFGHEKGAFTGATDRRIGRFELAHTGTLFLDEIGDLSLEAQAKLLRAIESSEIQRVGGNRPIKVDVRIIAATNKDLSKAVTDGSFREDLYFRLHVIPIYVPPLRERRGDIAELIKHFSDLHRRKTGQAELKWTPGAMEMMTNQAWPGNIRELANIVERLAILHAGREVTASDVRAVLPADMDPYEPDASLKNLGLNDMLDSMEKKIISNALTEAEGNVTEAARKLNTDRPNLYRRMKRLGLALLIMLAGLSEIRAQMPDSVKTDTLPKQDSLYVRDLIYTPNRHSSLKLSSGKTYNRVEGLPVYVGPTYEDLLWNTHINFHMYGIYRTSDNLKWDSGNIGHKVGLDLKRDDDLGFTISTELYDIVAPIENWQMQEPEIGLSTFFLHRDYQDYFGRHGGSVQLSIFTWSEQAKFSVKWSRERWSSRDARRVFTLFRNGQNWRSNPAINDGKFNTGSFTIHLDTRNDTHTPWAGWFLDTDYELGSGIGQTYQRGFIDIRKYNRISPKTQLNARFVWGGYLGGDGLPIQRMFSIGGPATIPGFNFNPTLNERVALVQLEYRNELNLHFIDEINKVFHPHGAARFVQPSIVAFADGGKTGFYGETLKDVGLGIDLGKIGIYAAKAVSDADEPVNFFVRLRRRF